MPEEFSLTLIIFCNRLLDNLCYTFNQRKKKVVTMNKEQILEWLDKNNRGFTQKDFELFKKFYEWATKELQEQQKQIEKMKCGGNWFCKLLLDIQEFFGYSEFRIEIEHRTITREEIE